MSKKKLALDALNVESFEPHPGAPSPRGTVQAHDWTGFTSYCECRQVTRYGTCQGTCVNTCGGPTCEAPCDYPDTFYMTCQEGCSWTDGDYVCNEPVTSECL